MKKGKEMNYNITFILLCVCTLLHCSEMTTNKQLLRALIDRHNNPTPALLKILTIMKSPHNGTLPSITSTTQEWLRPAGKERWQTHDTFVPIHEHHLSPLFKELCLEQKIEPLQKSYDYALLLGGTVDDVRNRLAYLITLSNQGIRFGALVILTGQRQLDATLESHELLLHNTRDDLPSRQEFSFNGHFPETETEMITFILQQTDIPAVLHKIPHFLIDTPMQMGENGFLRRPNTQDTITQWLTKCNPHAGSILAVSNQPFVGYQNAVLRNNMPQGFTIETVGNAYENNESIATRLDALARWIYNENQKTHTQQAKY